MTTTSKSRSSGLPASAVQVPSLDVHKARADFPILARRVHGKPLVYFDNAATSQKPRSVIEALDDYYRRFNSNVHRGLHQLSAEATEAYERTRTKLRRYFHADQTHEAVYTRGATEAINLVAQSYARTNLRAGDEVLITHMEHHSNLVPWQIVCQQTGATLRVAPIDERGELVLEEFQKLLSERTRIVAVVHVSNSLGTINPVQRIVELAHQAGAVVLIDGAQAMAHLRPDLHELKADFYALSGHKMFGPTGIGALLGRRELLDAMPPWQGGGEMVDTVTLAKTTYADPPARFEAGTPHIAGAVGLGAAIDYLESLDLNAVAAHEHDLLEYATARLSEIPGLRLIGTAPHKAPVLSFTLDSLHAYDAAPLLDHDGVAVRTGHHCTQPVMDRFGITATIRASLALYNTREEIDTLIESLQHALATGPARESAEPAASHDTTLVFPEPAGASTQEAADELIDAFDMLGDWEDRYAFVVELGEQLPAMPTALKTEQTRVRGCQSVVHLYARRREAKGAPVIDFLADSDAALVRGLIGVLERLFAGRPAQQVLDFDVESLFRKLGLSEHLTVGRRNGLEAMVKRIRTYARDFLQPA